MANRILTTHVGSLPRSEAVTQIIFAQERGEHCDPGHVQAVLSEAVSDCVKKQVAAGVDIVSDGETSKVSYATYIKDRISGFDGDSPRRAPADLEQFPSFLKRQAKGGGTPEFRRPRCVGEVKALTLEPLHADLKRFAIARERHYASAGFMNAASPGVIALFQPNDFYATEDEYLEAVAEAMRPEYEAIAEAGLTLQIDSPDLGLGRHTMYKDRSESEYIARIERHVEVLNHALRNISPAKLRLHICWGNYEGPHVCDIEMDKVFATLMRAKPAGLLFESANPRHQHDWETFENRLRDIPEDKVLIPGCIDTTTNFVEHPRVVANRITQFVNIVGSDRVIAGTDCGFSTFAGFGVVDEQIVWAKLGALCEGAEIASQRVRSIVG